MFKKYPIEAQFLGPDPAILHQLADSARAIMERTPEVCLITTDWEPQVPVLTIEYDQPSARALGLSRNDVSLSCSQPPEAFLSALSTKVSTKTTST